MFQGQMALARMADKKNQLRDLSNIELAEIISNSAFVDGFKSREAMAEIARRAEAAHCQTAAPNQIDCPHCGGCGNPDRCNHCGNCKHCGKPIKEYTQPITIPIPQPYAPWIVPYSPGPFYPQPNTLPVILPTIFCQSWQNTNGTSR